MDNQALAEQIRQAVSPLVKHRKQPKRRHDYFGRVDREDAAKLAACIAALDDMVGRWEQQDRGSGLLVRNAKLSRHWAGETLDQLLGDMPRGRAEQVYREIGRKEIVIIDR